MHLAVGVERQLGETRRERFERGLVVDPGLAGREPQRHLGRVAARRAAGVDAGVVAQRERRRERSPRSGASPAGSRGALHAIGNEGFGAHAVSVSVPVLSEQT